MIPMQRAQFGAVLLSRRTLTMKSAGAIPIYKHIMDDAARSKSGTIGQADGPSKQCSVARGIIPRTSSLDSQAIRALLCVK